MPKIGRYPPFCKSFFRRARKIVGSCHFAHLWRVVMALASMQGRRSLSRMQGLAKDRRTRQAISHFLSHPDWNAPRVLAETALEKLRQLGCGPGETVYVVIDDTQILKYGRRMDAVWKIYLHGQKRYATGHTMLCCALIYRGVTIPYALDLWTPKTFSGRPFRKLTDMAGDLLRQVVLPAGVRGIALFDAYYLCPQVSGDCREQRFDYVGASYRNRRFFPDGRPRDVRRLKTYGPNVLARDGQTLTLGTRRSRIAQRVGQLPKLGRVKLVFDRRAGETVWRTLVTNQCQWSPRTVLMHYLARWGIESMFKMLKQHLGLGDYQVLRYTGVVRHLHLVLIAYLLLTHLALAQPDAKAQLHRKKPLQLASIPMLQSQLRIRLWNDTLTALGRNPKHRNITNKIQQEILL